MPTAPQTLAALLGSRICHDLVSPIGAISNGVELLQMSNSPGGPELDLIHESVENANARIRFFRIAFGVATNDQRLGRTEINDILGDLSRGTRMDILWQSESDLPRADVKLVFLMIQCIEAALPWGGTITVTQEGAAWQVVGESDRMKDITPLWSALRDMSSPVNIGAAEVQFLLFPTLLQESGRTLSLDVNDTEVSARF